MLAVRGSRAADRRCPIASGPDGVLPLRDLWRGLVELLLPSACAGCNERLGSDRILCPRCDRALPRLSAGACSLCQERPPVAPDGRCPQCSFRSSPLAACFATCPFAGEVERWVHRFKYPVSGLAGFDPSPGAVLRALIVEAAQRAAAFPPDRVVSIPLHRRRLRARGFNPAALLAQVVARQLSVPYSARTLERIRDTPTQTGLDRRERIENVRGAFRVKEPPERGSRIWLVDDVVTTGSTLGEAARSLRGAGVRSVVGICAARTLRPGR